MPENRKSRRAAKARKSAARADARPKAPVNLLRMRRGGLFPTSRFGDGRPPRFPGRTGGR